jgi:hypothetical protein
MIGLGAGAFFAPTTVSFHKRRAALAVAVVSAGMGEVCLRAMSGLTRRPALGKPNSRLTLV